MPGKNLPPSLKIWIPALLIIAGILAITVSIQRIVVSNTADAFNRQQLFLVREAAKGIEELIQNIKIRLDTADQLLTEDDRRKIFEALYTNQQGLLEGLFLCDARGSITFAFPESAPDMLSEGGIHELRAFISSASPQSPMVISDILFFNGEEPRDFSFVIAVPLSDAQGWLCCIPDFVMVKKKYIYPVRSGDTGYAWMIDRNGILIAHPNKGMEGRKAIDILKELWPEYSSFNLETIINREMITGEEGSGEYTGWHFGEKKLTKKLIAYCPIRIEGLSWSIGVSAPYREAMQPLMDSIAVPVVLVMSFIGIIVAGAFLLVLQDKRKRLVNQELEWSQEVFDGITDGISIIDRDFRVLMVNKAVSTLQGMPQQFFKGKKCFKVYQNLEDLCAGCPAKEAFETGRTAFRERVSATVGGKQYYFQMSAFPLKDSDGNTVKVAECIKDITEEVRLRAELLQHEQKSVIVKMSAQVAHEIRNPLGTLTLNIDLLEDEIQNYPDINAAEAKNLITAIKSELDGLNRVLQEYLECTRFPRISPREQRIEDIIDSLFSMLYEELKRKRITFKTSFEYNLPAARADVDQIRRAFLNIIRNAMEVTPAGGIIEVAARRADDWIEITFCDSGPGISHEEIEKIFTPFYTTKKSGTGLGLSITQHIIAEHQGRIYCESAPARGTRFIVRIPRWTGPDTDI